MINPSRRTIFLAVVATATLVWSAIYSFDVPVEEMAWLALYSVLGVFFIIFLAALAFGTTQLLKWLVKGGWRQDEDSN